jgi:virginiamycin A acetyltransferase
MFTVARPSNGTRPPVLKRVLNRLALVMVSPSAATCWLERRAFKRSESFFAFWTHVFAVLPGRPGMFLRRAFYRWTLESCHEDVTIEFGALFNRRNARMDAGAYVGAYALIGSVWLQEGALVGSRASLLSGGQQHELLPTGEWGPTDHSKLSRIVIGRNTWIGEGAILMADTGPCCMVAAGAVVSTAVPPGVMVAGNPARFVKKLIGESSRNDNTVSTVR